MKLIRKLFIIGLLIGSTLGVLVAVNRRIESQIGELDTVLTGDERRYPWKYGDIFYKVNGLRDAKPLLLIHSIAPGASSYEWRKNVDALAERFRVYVIDLLGFGLSDRPAIDYKAEMYPDLVRDFIAEVIGKPTIVVAHGTTTAYVIAAAYSRPQVFERLVLVMPPMAILQEKLLKPAYIASKFILRAPILGQFIYNILTSHRAIRNYFDRLGYHNPTRVTDELVEYAFTNAHQVNSHFPFASFFDESLLMEVREPLAGLQIPMVAIWGREGSQGTLTASEISEAFKRINPRLDIRVLDNCNQQLQDEQSSKFNNLVCEFAGKAITQ